MSAANISRALHGRTKAGGGFLARCPLPSHGKGRGDRDPSLSLDDGEGGRLLVRCFAGCDARDVLRELRVRGLLADRPRDRSAEMSAPQALPARQARTEPHGPSLEIWHASVAATEETATARYLRNRGVAGAVSLSIRHNSGVTYPPSGLKLPAMVSAIQAPDRRIIAVHLTCLDPAGRKSNVSKPKLFPTGARLGGGAVRLAAAGDALGIAEGIEDGLSAMALAGVPVWCALGVARFASIAIPASVRELHLFAQNDPPVSEAAKALDRAADAFATQGRRVLLRRPPEGFKDWNAWHAAGAPPRAAA